MKDIFENEMKLEFISKSKNEAFARVTVAAFASQLDPTIEELADIKTAVSEAVTNCIIHGYESKQGIVKIVGHLKENEIILEISDKGKGIENIDVAKEPLYTTKPNLERSGMGFTIMESFMDTMEIESIVGLGTKVTMSKKIRPRIETEEEDFYMMTKD
ncbi:MAG: anti-sigma F factor [Clostridia bacterium]|nr:anti-sigma F factor [Clostridia bacterium]